MSFGFGVGDFIAVLKIANTIRKEFVGAPDQFKDISDEVRSLTIVLQDVDVIVSECELSDQQQAHLQEIALGCEGVLEKLEKTLDKYGKLDSNKGGLGKRAKRVWERLKWEPEDIRELRDRVTSNIVLLNAFLEGISTHATLAVRKGVDRLNQKQDNQERLTILDWLSPVDFAAEQQDFLSWREPGTGQWLLDSAEHQTWLNTKGGTLFCPGIPGAGKTVLAALTIDDLFTRFDQVPDVGLAFVYCNFRRHDEQKAHDLLASLLKQLSSPKSPLPEAVKALYERHRERRTRPTFEEVSNALESITASYSRVFIVIDALDECQASDNCRTRFLAEVFKLREKSGANVFATSRFIPEIIGQFKGSPLLEIRASPEDVERYVKSHVLQLRPFVQRSIKLQEEITTAISEAVDGMFLLAHIYLGSLDDKPTPKAVRSALAQFQKLPQGPSEEIKVQILSRAYDQAMERVNGQKAGLQELAIQVLSWITCAKRPLTILELQHALAVEADEPDIDEENLPEVEDMVAVCAGLVRTDEESGIIRLVHYTTQEYFERTWDRWFPNAQHNIAITCITYLAFDIFAGGSYRTKYEYRARVQKYPLYPYTAQNWGYHAHKASSAKDAVVRFLSNTAKVSAAYQAMDVVQWPKVHYDGKLLYSCPWEFLMEGMHLAAWFGLKEVTAYLLEQGWPPDCQVSGRTPLSFAAENGQKELVDFLLEKKVVAIDAGYHSPLSYAVMRGKGAVVESLLKHGANPNACCPSDGYTGPFFFRADETALQFAVNDGNEDIVRLLLEYRADVDSVIQRVEQRQKHLALTPLTLAAQGGHEGIVKLLLDNGAAVNPKGCPSPLPFALASGHDAIAKLLRSNGA